jgi:hypothetical protein
MGFFSAGKQLLKTTVKIAALPVAVVADTTGLSIPKVANGGPSFTESVFKSIENDPKSVMSELDKD